MARPNFLPLTPQESMVHSLHALSYIPQILQRLDLRLVSQLTPLSFLPGRTVNWIVPSSGQLSNVTVPVGGSVTFSWQGQHNVYEVRSYACPSRFAAPDATLVSETSSGGSSVVNFASAGTRYFACSVSSHCRQGMFLLLRIWAHFST